MDTKELEESYSRPSEARKGSFERVREFHEVFGHPIVDRPSELDFERLSLRLELIREEFCELLEASGLEDAAMEVRGVYLNPDGEQNLVEIADALGDLEYVINGMALEAGIPLPDVVAEIHQSNMSKLGPDGKPIYREDGKILKGEGFKEPRLAEILGI